MPNTSGRARLFLGICCLVALPVRADICALVNRDVADRAVEAIRQTKVIVNEDWFTRIQVETVEWVREGFLYRVEVNGDHQLELSQVYILNEEADQFQSLGWMFSEDCGIPESPRSFPTRPMTKAVVTPSAVESNGLAEPLIGILEVPNLLGGFSEGLWAEPSGNSIAIYAQPSTVGEIAARIPDTSRVKKLEYSYESSGIVTLERARDWFRVQLEPAGTGWIQPGDHEAFHPFENLIEDGLSYLTSEWNGKLYESPRFATVTTAMDPAWRHRLGDEISVRTLESRRLDDRLWFRVELLEESACTGREPRVFATGWIPGHSASGQPAVWFYSRGC